MIEYENLHRSNQSLIQDYQIAISNVLSNGWFVLGNEVKHFEHEFSKYCGTEYCVGVGNGLDALILTLKTLKLPKGSEVIVPSNTYIATILAILEVGFTPILVEPDIRTYNIDPDKIIERITTKTRVILVVHLYGKCADMIKIMRIAKDYSLFVIEDAAQAHGSSINGKKAGSFGDMAAFSFYPTKNLGALGDAGGITSNNLEYIAHLRKLRNYGSDVKYYNDIIGVNSRLDELQAAVLRVKLKKLDLINSRKRELAKIYNSELSEDVIKPIVENGYNDVYHIYNIRTKFRDKLKEHLFKKGIITEIHYPLPPHKQNALNGILGSQSFPIADEIHQSTLSLPISFFHTDEEVNQVCEAVNIFFN